MKYQHGDDINSFGQIIGCSIKNWASREQPYRKMIQGDYCVLEPLDIQKYGKALYQALRHDEVWTYLPFGPFNAFIEFEQWLLNDSKHKLFYIIMEKNRNIPEGLASYHDIDQAHGVIEVGSIIYSQQLQKTRAATEAMYLMMKHVFDDLGYRRYQWRCNALNSASRKAAVRLGFTFEGIFRQACVLKGYNRDTAWYSIIDHEWPAIKIKFQKWLHPNNFDSNGQQITSLQKI